MSLTPARKAGGAGLRVFESLARGQSNVKSKVKTWPRTHALSRSGADPL